jgi:type VI protein secretion system component VasK
MTFNGGFIWSMIWVFFMVMFIWMFIAVFADIFRRNDIHGGVKALWIILIIILPFIGILIYVIARPKMTEQDKEDLQKAQEAQRRMQGYSAADEIEKLKKLHDSGALTDAEFEAQKKAALTAV